MVERTEALHQPARGRQGSTPAQNDTRALAVSTRHQPERKHSRRRRKTSNGADDPIDALSRGDSHRRGRARQPTAAARARGVGAAVQAPSVQQCQRHWRGGGGRWRALRRMRGRRAAVTGSLLSARAVAIIASTLRSSASAMSFCRMRPAPGSGAPPALAAPSLRASRRGRDRRRRRRIRRQTIVSGAWLSLERPVHKGSFVPGSQRSHLHTL